MLTDFLSYNKLSAECVHGQCSLRFSSVHDRLKQDTSLYTPPNQCVYNAHETVGAFRCLFYSPQVTRNVMKAALTLPPGDIYNLTVTACTERSRNTSIPHILKLGGCLTFDPSSWVYYYFFLSFFFFLFPPRKVLQDRSSQNQSNDSVHGT